MNKIILSAQQEILENRATLECPRSSHWPHVRDMHLTEHPLCEVCHGNKSLNVHHIKPYHLFPKLELAGSNLITLCEAETHGVNCHLWFGHLGNFKQINPSVVADTLRWFEKFKSARAVIGLNMAARLLED